MKKLTAILISLCMALVYIPVKAAEADHLEIHQISVGTGDAALIRYFEDGEDYNVVIDGGYGTAFLKKYRNNHYPDVTPPTALDSLLSEESLTDEAVEKCIAQFKSESGKTDTGNDALDYLNGLSFNGEQLKIDYLINSHPHYDHSSGLASIAYNYKIKNFILWSQDAYSKFYDLFRKIVDKKVEGISYTINEDDKGVTTVTTSGGDGDIYTLTYNNGNDTMSVPAGATVTLSAEPEDGYTFKTFSAIETSQDGDPGFVQVPGSTFVMPSYDTVVKATYEKQVTKKANLIIPGHNYTFQLGSRGPVFKQMAYTGESYRKSNFSGGTANANMNNQSLAWCITYAGRKFITSGDLQRVGEAKIIANHASDIANADIYKQDHHGFVNADGYSSSTYSGHYAYAKAVNASETIISYGSKTDYGVYGCTEKVLNDSKHSYVYKTYAQGTIIVTINSDGSYSLNKSASVKGTKTVSRGALNGTETVADTDDTAAYTAGLYQTTTDVPVRSGPGTSYSKLGVLTKGTQIAVTEITNVKWAIIDYNGTTAYFSLLNTTKISDDGEASTTTTTSTSESKASEVSSSESSSESEADSSEASSSEAESSVSETTTSETTTSETTTETSDGAKTLTVPSAITVYKGNTVNLNAKTSPSATIKYTTSNKKIATVTSKGVVKGIKAGTAKITVKANGLTQKVTVKVVNKSLTLNKTSFTIKKGKTAKIVATPKPDVKVTYKSSKKSVAKVSSTGVITAVKKGSATITVKANGITKKVKVKVK